jgi:hypothetical protein
MTEREVLVFDPNAPGFVEEARSAGRRVTELEDFFVREEGTGFGFDNWR